jgi:tRNA A-37 threonylcarbamoyl transferase component Bud32
VSAPEVELEVDVVAHLRRRGLLGAVPVHVERLSGGVSGDVVAVAGPDVALVVKRALSRLRVDEEWLADPNRILTEAAALRVAGELLPGHVPPVLDVDPTRRTIVIGRAEPGAHEWKTDLLAGVVDVAVARRLGEMLAAWHAGTEGRTEIAAEFASTVAFEQLRIDPFHRWVARRHPDLAPAIDTVVERMGSRRTCLVHGDFSPKNVLLGPATTWVLDWEVAHYGDPSFDVAFLLAHLLCKTLHRPNRATEYRRAATEFQAAYRDGVAHTGLPADEAHLTAQTACLLLARMDGKSPVPYLDGAARARGRALARALLADPAAHPDTLWRTL